MAFSFSANQYERHFISKHLCNYEIPHAYREMPKARYGFTEMASNDRGHLLPTFVRSTKNPWGNFVPTWDLPNKLPGPRVLVPTARSYDAHDKLIREMYKLKPFINGMSKNGRRRVRIEDTGPATKKPIRLGSISPAHRETCKDLQPFVEDKPETSEPDSDLDDHIDDRYSDTKTCLEQVKIKENDCIKQQQNTDRSHSSRGSSTSPSAAPRRPTSRGSVTPSICDKPLRTMYDVSPSPNVCGSPRVGMSVCSPMLDPCSRPGKVKYSPPPLEVPGSDQTYAFAGAIDQVGLSYEPPVGSPCPLMSPFKNASRSPKPRSRSKPIPPECLYRTKPSCSPVKTTCGPMYGYSKFTERPTEGSYEYITEPMRLKSPPVMFRDANFQESPSDGALHGI